MIKNFIPAVVLLFIGFQATQINAQSCSGPLSGVVITGSTSGVALTAVASVTSNYNGAQISCFPGQGTSNNGTATVTPAGGSTPYTYSWSNGQTSQSASGLTAGTYTVVVTDNKGCNTSTTVTLTGPTEIQGFTCTNANDNCQVNAGQVLVQATGGTGALTASWTSACTPPAGPAQGTPAGNVQTAIPALYSGLTGNCTYNFVVTDANMCTDNN